jgi:hypothetical protein
MSKKNVKNTELAWAAGFFDGEGCTTITSFKSMKKNATDRKRPYCSMRQSIAQVHIEPLIRFHQAIGLGAVRGPYKYKSNKQYHYQWNASGMDVIKVLDQLWPYLSKIKREQALDKVSNYIQYLKKYPARINQFSPPRIQND